MPKPDQRSSVLQILFIILLVPAVWVSCRQKPAETASPEAVKVQPSDTANLLALDKLIRDNPKNPDLFYRRARLCADQKNYSQALNDVSIALRLDSLKPAYYVSQAEYFIFNGEPNSAKKTLGTCLKKFPNNTDAMLKLAEIHLYLKEYGQAKIILRDILPINDDLAQIYFLQGLVAVETGDTTGAVRNFQITIEKEPDYYAAYIQAGKLYANRKDPLAQQYFQSAIDLQPNLYEGRYLLGMYFQESGMLPEAEQEYEFISSNIDSTMPDPYYNRGYIELVYRGDYTKAAEWFSKAIECKPDYADAWYNRGFSHELGGQLSKAREDYRQAMELEPNFPLAIKGLNRIEDGKSLKKQ